MTEDSHGAGRTRLVDYVLPLRWSDDTGLAELTRYLRWLSGVADVIVVDASAPPLFARHAERWRGLVQHLPPDPDLRFANGKVNGVLTGLRRTRREQVVLADDDVRYDLASLYAVARLLADADLVRPQNVFAPLPWHARWDTARCLLNRCLSADYPGTFGVRRATLLGAGGYDGDVLFENLELIRTVRAAGGREVRPLDLYVRRLPPTVTHFAGQRVRQAYDDLAQPARLLASLAVLPAAGAALARRRGLLAAGAGAAVIAAEIGRRRAGGRAVFPADIPLYAPLWMLERAVCSWLAVGQRLRRGGIGYAGNRIRVAAHSRRQLAQRVQRAAPPCREAGPATVGRRSAAGIGAGAGPEPAGPVGAVAERLA
jgi:hypothetical protein